MVYFHPLNLYLGESEFFGSLEGTMTSGLLAGLRYSTLAVLSDSGFFAFASFGARHAS